MKTLSLVLIGLFVLCAPVFGFLYEVQILSLEEVKKIDDDKLMAIYTEAMIERRATETFHGKAGFSPKEYKGFKALLGFIIRLRQEMQERNLDVPPIEEWLR
ncbi:MAG: hypothetical protein K8S27_07940 [Candidatus Omnitrophica bacterium]|nr:hypothetical protein [Candidatus Omnitrophota bacterium]